MKVACIIVAAGSGSRAGGEIPKQYRLLGIESVLARSIRSVLADPRVDKIICAIGAGQRYRYDRAVNAITDNRLFPPIAGGGTRRESVLQGLLALQPDPPELVLIHDAARPFLPPDVLARVIDGLANHQAVFPALPVTDTIWQSTGNSFAPVTRDGLWQAQTPQGFHFDPFLRAHLDNTAQVTDDISVARLAGMQVKIVESSSANLKLTTADDLLLAERRFGTDVRTGTGFDVHAFAEGNAVTLCGARIPFGRGLSGHSDADVAMHAITDAVLGALAEGDIGHWFPPSDPQWKGADSAIFLRKAVELCAARPARISHLDCTIICEEPKIGPHAAAMRANIAAICGIGSDRVSIKATTTERLGFTGRGEGIAAMATATLVFA